MIYREANGALEMRWLPVTDDQGRTHMEAVWFTPTPAAVSTAA